MTAGWNPSHIPLRRIRLIALINIPLAVWYFSWLYDPRHAGHLVLYGLLLAAETFNLVQAAGFWATCLMARPRPAPPPPPDGATVDVFVPTYDEPDDVVEPTVAAATRMTGATVRVHVLDDGGRPAIRAVAERYGARYVHRRRRTGAKAGNINHALAETDAPYIAVFDCDHVPERRFLEATLGYMRDERVAVVQTPQFYGNTSGGGVASAAWAQQALFFGPIALGKDGLGAMFCCGTNVVYNRAALARVGGIPEKTVTEDFELSLRLHETGWRTVYVPEVLARGLAPEDMSSYVSQQFRWARGCISAIGRILLARLPLRHRVQYLLSSMWFLTGWTLLLYMSFPIIRMLTGHQPLAVTSAHEFLLHFGPYFITAVLAVAVAGSGAYTFHGFALAFASFHIHIRATVSAVLGRKTRFVVTPKRGRAGPQPRAVVPALVMASILGSVATVALLRSRSPATLNNVGFALLHMTVLLRGAWPALVGSPERAGPARELAPATGS